MADRGKKGLVARWLEGKERSEEYARSTLPTNRWALFWDILKGRFWKLVLVNLMMLVTLLPLIAVVIWRNLSIMGQGYNPVFGSGLGVGFPVIPQIAGAAEYMVFQGDLIFFALIVASSFFAALGISGGGYIIRNLIWTEGIFVANDFVRGIKRNYWNVLEALLLFSVVLFTARTAGNLADYYVAANVQGSARGWMIASKVIGYFLMCVALLVCFWMISLGINYKQGPWALFRNAVVMTIGTLPQTIVFVALSVWPVFLVIFGGSFILVIGAILMILFGVSYMLLVWMDFSQWAFDRFVNPQAGYQTGRGLYDKNKPSGKASQQKQEPTMDSEAMREYKRMIVAQGKSKLVCRPIKPLDDDLDVYQLPESFSREDLRRLKESKDAIEEDVKAYEEEHKNDEQYVEYNRQFEEREKALQEENGKKKKPPKPPKMLTRKK